jgi:hypothetical protein
MYTILKSIKRRIKKIVGKVILTPIFGKRTYIKYDLGLDYADDGMEHHVMVKSTYNYYTDELIHKEIQTMDYHREDMHSEYCPVCKGETHNPEIHQSLDNLLEEINEFQKNRSKQAS